MKVQFSIDDELMKKLDNFADENFMSRSGLATLAINQFLVQNEVQRAVDDLSRTMKKIADEGLISPESQRELADFERICSLFVGK